ncbi:MAG: hypothetical protein CM1200mP27_13160 [Chloroflexota bacterium]|nr:MAG: hypothetical protein CM1200mP27_13160 [Chloroflexota bacterium]
MRCIIALIGVRKQCPYTSQKFNSRDGFFVISRTKNDNFEWEHFKQGKGFSGRFFSHALGFISLCTSKPQYRSPEVDLLTGLNLNDAMENFRSGKAEYIHVPQPAAEELLEDGSGHLAVALGPENGHLAYSSFATTHNSWKRGPISYIDSQ